MHCLGGVDVATCTKRMLITSKAGANECYTSVVDDPITLGVALAVALGAGPAGEAWVMLETSVDLRGSQAWSQFDDAMTQFGGPGGETRSHDAGHDADVGHQPAADSDEELSDAGAPVECMHAVSRWTAQMRSLGFRSNLRKHECAVGLHLTPRGFLQAPAKVSVKRQ